MVAMDAELAPLISEALSIAEQLNESVNAYEYVAYRGAAVLKSSSKDPFAAGTRALTRACPELILKLDAILTALDRRYKISGYKPLDPQIIHGIHPRLLGQMTNRHGFARELSSERRPTPFDVSAPLADSTRD